MQNKIDIIIDVSKRLTEQWEISKIFGVDHPDAWIYGSNPELYSKYAPATFDKFVNKAKRLDIHGAALLLESISCDLFQLCVEEGWFDDPFKIDRPTDSIKLDTPAQIGFHKLKR